jgi:hypothetical protein
MGPREGSDLQVLFLAPPRYWYLRPLAAWLGITDKIPGIFEQQIAATSSEHTISYIKFSTQGISENSSDPSSFQSTQQQVRSHGI